MKPRQIRIEGSLAYVPLTRGYVAIVDAGCVDCIKAGNWMAEVTYKASGEVRAVYARRAGYVKNGERSPVHMHRVIISAPDGTHVDHIDGDGLNNRLDNLRLVTATQNRKNRRISVHNKSGFKGVHWSKSKAKWVASIGHDGKRYNLGVFARIEDAAAAYAAASAKLHGEFGRVE